MSLLDVQTYSFIQCQLKRLVFATVGLTVNFHHKLTLVSYKVALYRTWKLSTLYLTTVQVTKISTCVSKITYNNYCHHNNVA